MARRKTDTKADEAETHRFRGSSRVNRAKWTASTKLLEVVFVDGTRWVYRGVPEGTWRRFKAAPSAGRFVQDHLDRFPNHRA